MTNAGTPERPVTMHRPHLSAAQETLARHHRPTQECPHCRATPTTWVMEVPQWDQPLEFYCRSCGLYVLVPMGALGV